MSAESASELPALRLPASEVAPFEVPLGELALPVLVGVTGVGKSTALAALRAADPETRVLPDRREVTDAVMILPATGGPVRDREERFRLTAAYRDAHPGGMAQALGSLLADTRHWARHWGKRPVFDGLRGEAEVAYAATHCPRWRFVALEAPDLVRVQRLLGRADAFDQVRGAAADDLRPALEHLSGAAEVFSPAQLDELAALTAQGHAASDILAKTRIVLSERRHYDPAAAARRLRALPSERALVLDTVALGPEEVARAVGAWL